MLHYAQLATDFLGSATFDDVAADECTFYAIAHCIQEVGGAARQVSDDARSDLSELDWPNLIAMRDRMAKEYRTVTPELVVEIVRNDFPSLVALLRRAGESSTL